MRDFKLSNSSSSYVCVLKWNHHFQRYKCKILLPDPFGSVDITIEDFENNLDVHMYNYKYYSMFVEEPPIMYGSLKIINKKESKFSGYLSFVEKYMKRSKNQEILNSFGIKKKFPVEVFKKYILDDNDSEYFKSGDIIYRLYIGL